MNPRHGTTVDDGKRKILARILVGGGPGYGGSSCWTWTRGKTRRGYGQIHFRGKNRPAHRLAYELFIGPIPEHLHLDHLCENPSCVYPGHLEPVPPQVNLVRSTTTIAGSNARKTHCPHGHEFTPANTRVDPKGSRRCRTCCAAQIYAVRNGLDFETVARSRRPGSDLRHVEGPRKRREMKQAMAEMSREESHE